MSIYELSPFPPEYTYRETRRSIEHDDSNNDYLNFLTSRETKKAISDLNRKRERDAGKEEENLTSHPYELGVKKVKRVLLLDDI